MKTTTRIAIASIALIVCFLPSSLRGQVAINALHLPKEMCVGDELTVSFGPLTANTVMVGTQTATLGHSERIFLPDGVMCDGSCSYRSPVTFTAFADTARINSVENIKYVRLNIEHSYIGDIYVNITCPDGQKADLMRFAGNGASACDGAIPMSSRRWLDGHNMSEDTYFGRAYDNQNQNHPCDETAPGNQPGTGWNYCWSSNTTSNYQYASGDGIIYRAGHAHAGSVDSSNVAARTNFYHPDEDFSNLVGCPLNGTWYIEVVDGFSVDNGYIFEWELSLDASLIPDQCFPESYHIEGGETTRLNDSTFRIKAPASVAADSTVQYRFIVITSCGDTIDTTAAIVYHPDTEYYLSDTICEGRFITVGGQRIAEAGQHDVLLTTSHGCDSTVHVDLTLHPRYDLQFEDSTCLNDPYAFDDSIYHRQGTYQHRYTTIHGCDSLRTLHLTIQSLNLKARMRAFPLVVNSENLEIDLLDESMNHVGSRWLIDGNVYLEPSLTITYPVELDSMPISLEAVSREGCYDTATSIARYDRSVIFIPNAFTPTEATNTEWRPIVEDMVYMEVWIYDRRGSLVAHWEGVDGSWDGGESPTGAYVYTLAYRTRVYPQWEQKRTGTILLLR